MRLIITTCLALIILGPAATKAACVNAVRHLSIELQGNNWEGEAAILDDLAVQLQADPALRAEVIVYGAQRGHRNEVGARVSAYGEYLIATRGVAQSALSLRAGGYRHVAMMEVWLLSPGSCPVPATPTVPTRSVVFTPGRFVIHRV